MSGAYASAREMIAACQLRLLTSHKQNLFHFKGNGKFCLKKNWKNWLITITLFTTKNLNTFHL